MMNIENEFLINYKCDYFLNVITKYDVENMYHTYNKILELWKPRSSDHRSEKCNVINEGHIREHNGTFTGIHCSQAEHYLSKVETNSEPQHISNACKYFMYWLYYDVLKQKLDNHKILKIYKDVLTGYIKGSNKDYFKKYVSSFSENTIDKFIKLTKMYDYFHKFKENMQPGSNKCNLGTECIRLYNENIKVCEEGNDNDFCYELDNLKESYDKYLKSNERCPSLPKTLKSYSVYNPAVIIITPFSILLVISLTLFFLYKFTPFGSLFRKRIRNNKKITDNIDYATHLLPHTSQRVNNYNNNRQYNISYLSSGQ